MPADTRELTAWAIDLGEAADEVIPEARQVLSKGALQIKNAAKRKISGLAHAPYYPNAITYDIRQGGDWVQFEVGPDKSRRQGALGVLLEYGSVNNAPIPHITPAADQELPVIEKYLGDVVAKALGE